MSRLSVIHEDEFALHSQVHTITFSWLLIGQISSMFTDPLAYEKCSSLPPVPGSPQGRMRDEVPTALLAAF